MKERIKQLERIFRGYETLFFESYIMEQVAWIYDNYGADSVLRALDSQINDSANTSEQKGVFVLIKSSLLNASK